MLIQKNPNFDTLYNPKIHQKNHFSEKTIMAFFCHKKKESKNGEKPLIPLKRLGVTKC